MPTRAYRYEHFHFLSIVCVLLALGFAVACGGGSQTCSGTERCACYPNGTCNAGLTCLSNTCVNASTGTGGNAGATGAGGSAAGNGGAAAGTGGAVSGTGGSVGGTGGATTGTGGAASGTGGSVGGAGGAAAGTSGAAGRGGTGGTGGGMSGGAGGPGGTGSGGTGGACRLFQTVPGGSTAVPTVFLLVDRSGSMFGCAGAAVGTSACADPNNSTWNVMRAGVLSVVEDLQASVRFGFGAFTGVRATNMCPIFEQVSVGLNNHAAISALYGPLGAITGKAETPVGAGLARAKAILDADTTAGPKYILFVTDGEPDFCDDGSSLCAADSVVGHLQSLRTAGITTLIFGVQHTGGTTLPPTTLQAFANAGADQPVVPPLRQLETIESISDQCQPIQPWRDELAAAGKTFVRGVTLGSYSTSGGTATVYQPNPANAQALETLIATTVGGLKSCAFDLANGLAVDLSKVDQASVLIENQTVPRSDTNGWRMVNPMRLELAGSACALWRQPTSRSIDFQFPCGVVTGS